MQTKIIQVSELKQGHRFFVGTPKVLEELEDIREGDVPGTYAVREVKSIVASEDMAFAPGDALVWCHNAELSTGFLPYAYDDLIEVIVEHPGELLAERAEREARELEELLDAMSNGDADVADRHGITFADVARHTSYATFLFERRKALLSRGPMKVAA